LRIALLCYRGNPLSGGQGVYARYLSRELAAMGHEVSVLAGQPYPELVSGVALVKVPSLDLYRPGDPFRTPRREEFRGPLDAMEWLMMLAGRFGEPLTFSVRSARILLRRRRDFDVVHDNQGLGYGLWAVQASGLAVVATIHHPVTIDRDLEMVDAADEARRRSLRRWYGFVGMQRRVLAGVPRLITVSRSSAADIAGQMGARPEQLHVIPAGVDAEVFKPLPSVVAVPGRLMTTASADVTLKGLTPLLEALAKVRTERDAELVIVGTPRPDSQLPATIERLGLSEAVIMAGAVSTPRMVELYASSEVAVVPSLYEGFSLPAVEAMACGVALVTTTGGALPEVVGPSGTAALLVEPGDPGALAAAIIELLNDEALRARLGAAGRARILQRFTWRAMAQATVDQYRLAMTGSRFARAMAAAGLCGRQGGAPPGPQPSTSC